MSEVFFTFCKGLHQDFELYGSEPEDWIRGALNLVPMDARPELRTFLDRILNSTYSDDDLWDLYRRTWAEISFRPPSGLRWFLTLARDVMDGKPGQKLDPV
jgi:hypothetical protein